MGIFGKLLGKKKSDLALEKPPYQPMSPDEFGLPELGASPPKPQAPPELQPDFEPSPSPLRSYQPPTFNPVAQQALASRDVELILSKLDAIRSALTNIEIRIARLEKIAGVDEKAEKPYRW